MEGVSLVEMQINDNIVFKKNEATSIYLSVCLILSRKIPKLKK